MSNIVNGFATCPAAYKYRDPRRREIGCYMAEGHSGAHFGTGIEGRVCWGGAVTVAATHGVRLLDNVMLTDDPPSATTTGIQATPPKPLLAQAQDIITGQRRDDYGPVSESFNQIAAIWTAILGHPVTAHDVALCMIGLKVARATNGYHFDSFLDIAGYAGCAELLNDEAKESSDV